MSTRLLILAPLLLLLNVNAHAQCTGTSMGATTLVANGNWLPANVPGAPAPHPWPSNYPPITAMFGAPAISTCTICPAVFTTPICTDNYIQIYMCRENIYTFSLCDSDPDADFTLSVTSTVFESVPAWFAGSVFDNDGCGTANGPAQLEHVPSVNGFYRVRIFRNPCTIDADLCGILRVTCDASAVGINENPSRDADIHIQPNPAGDRIQVRTAIAGPGTWVITDAAGRTVVNGQSGYAGMITIEVNELRMGAYAIKVQGAQGEQAQGRFVKH